MMKQEFEKLIKSEVSFDDYVIIEIVYMYHPTISTKEDIAKMYNLFGMVIIKDMLPRAKEISILENEAQALRLRLDNLKEQIADLSK